MAAAVSRYAVLIVLGAALPAAADDAKARLAAAEQLVFVESLSWDAPQGVLRRFERPRPKAPWQPIGGPLTVWLGRAGLGWRSDAEAPPVPAPFPKKAEGDGRSPAGLFALADLWGYAPQPPAGIRLPYHQSEARTRCVDDVRSPDYGKIISAPPGPAPWSSAEKLRLPTDHYKYLIVVDYNLRKPRPGAGSCIFVHVAPAPGGPTAGCTALVEEDLLTLLRWLAPQKRPLLLQLPQPAVAAVAKDLDLPASLLR